MNKPIKSNGATIRLKNMEVKKKKNKKNSKRIFLRLGMVEAAEIYV